MLMHTNKKKYAMLTENTVLSLLHTVTHLIFVRQPCEVVTISISDVKSEIK